MWAGGEVRQSLLWSLQISKGKPSMSGGSNVLAEPESGGATALPSVLAARTSTLSTPLPRCTPTWKGVTSLLLWCLPPPRALRGALPTQRIPPPSRTRRPPPVSAPPLSTHPRPHIAKGLLGPSVPASHALTRSTVRRGKVVRRMGGQAHVEGKE